MVGGLESKAAEKGLVEMQKVHPDARRICRNMFEAQDGTKVRQNREGGLCGKKTCLGGRAWELDDGVRVRGVGQEGGWVLRRCADAVSLDC